MVFFGMVYELECHGLTTLIYINIYIYILGYLIQNSAWLQDCFVLQNMSSSLGRMTFPTEWKVIKFHGSSHHQPVVPFVLAKGEHACNIRIDIDQQITGRFVSCFEVAPRLETSIFATNVPNVGKYQKREHSEGQGWYPGKWRETVRKLPRSYHTTVADTPWS